MLFNIPLKQTRPIELNKAVNQYILNNYGEATLYNECRGALERVDKLRASLQYEKINLTIANDPQSSNDLEASLLDYLRLMQLLAKYLRFEQHELKPVDVQFFWSDSYEPKRSGQLKSAKYELACQFYNYAISLYYVACAKSAKDNDAERKLAITKLRNGLWAIEQIRQLLPNIQKDIKDQHYDLSLANLEFLEHTVTLYQSQFAGLCYKNLYFNMIPQLKTFGAPSVFAVLVEASKEFALANRCAGDLNAKFVPKNLLEQIQSSIQFNYVWCAATSYIELAKFHVSRIQDDLRGQNMGKALGFLSKTLTVLNIILQNKNFKNNIQLDQIRQLFQLQQQLVNEYNMKNLNIYKDQIVPEDAVPLPPMMGQLFIKPLQNPLFNEPLAEAQQFSGFISEEGLQLARDIKGFIEQQKYQLDEAFKSLQDQKNKVYSDNYVNFFLDLYHAGNVQSNTQVPTNLLEKIQYIRTRGGLQEADKIIQQQKCISYNNHQLLTAIENALQSERQEDEQLRNRYQGQWNRTPSAEVQKQYLAQFTDYKSKLAQAQNIDFEVMSGYDLFKRYATIAFDTDANIIAQLPKADNQNIQFLQNYQALFQQLVQCDQQVSTTSDEMKQIILSFLETINSTNYTKTAVDSISKGTPREQIYQEAMIPVSTFIEAFNQRMQSVSALISQVCGVAVELQKQKRASAAQAPQQSDQISQGMSDARSFIDNLDHSILFYQQLEQHLQELDRKVKDYIVARNLEKDERLQQLTKPQVALPLPQPAPPQHPIPQPQQVPQQGYGYPTQPQYPPQAYQQQYPPQAGGFQPPAYPQYPQYPQQQYPGQVNQSVPYGQYGNPPYNPQYPQPPYPQQGQWGAQSYPNQPQKK